MWNSEHSSSTFFLQTSLNIIRCLFAWAELYSLFSQISSKYNLIYVITKLGLLFVYDLETATAVYRNRISPDPIFLTADAPSVGGFYAVNRRGQVLLATVNESTIVPFVSNQVNIQFNRLVLLYLTYYILLPLAH